MQILAKEGLDPGAPIALVERHTGLSKDLLRTWEKRYGFPRPRRDASGDRRYDAGEVDKLRLIKRLIDGGQRPRHLMHLSLAELEHLARRSADGGALAAGGSRELGDYLKLVRNHDVEGLRGHFAQRLADSGLSSFVRELVAPLTTLIGRAWAEGEIDVAQEHLYSRAVQSVLASALTALPARLERPSLVLATVPGERHGLGLAMAEVLFALARCRCLAIGIETPIGEIARAAQARQADVLALSFTAVLPIGQVRRTVGELIALIPTDCEIWLGGAHPALSLCVAPRIRRLATLEAIGPVLASWRAEHGARLTSA